MGYTNFFPYFEVSGVLTLSAFKIHIIHVGNMNNKGTQALFKSDVHVIKNLASEAFISVSTTDIDGVKRLNLSINAMLPPVVDIPYERADRMAKKLGFARGSLNYKVFTLAMLICMFLEILLTVFSTALVKIGLKGFYRNAVIEHVKHCNLVISHSDENFKESASLLPLNPYWVITWWSMLISRTCDILVAKTFGKPVIMFPNSVGPFRTWFGRCLSKLSLNNCDCLFIRDTVSYEIVTKLATKSRKILSFDTALLFSPPQKKVVESLPRPLLGVSPGIYSHSLSSKEINNYIQAHSKALDESIEKYGFTVIFLPHYISGFSHDDLEVCNLILERMKNRNRAKIICTYVVDEFKLFLDQMDMMVSSKMHPAVLAMSGYVPTLCIAYDHKQKSFFERLGMADCTLDIRMVTYEKLMSKIAHVWNRRDRLRASLENQIPQWKRNIETAIRQTVASYLEIR